MEQPQQRKKHAPVGQKDHKGRRSNSKRKKTDPLQKDRVPSRRGSNNKHKTDDPPQHRKSDLPHSRTPSKDPSSTSRSTRNGKRGKASVRRKKSSRNGKPPSTELEKKQKRGKSKKKHSNSPREKTLLQPRPNSNFNQLDTIEAQVQAEMIPRSKSRIGKPRKIRRRKPQTLSELGKPPTERLLSFPAVSDTTPTDGSGGAESLALMRYHQNGQAQQLVQYGLPVPDLLTIREERDQYLHAKHKREEAKARNSGYSVVARISNIFQIGRKSRNKL